MLCRRKAVGSWKKIVPVHFQHIFPCILILCMGNEMQTFGDRVVLAGTLDRCYQRIIFLLLSSLL